MNLAKQLLVLYVNGQVKLISHTSSGSGIAYCETATWQGKVQRFCGDARTPTGDYKTTWRRDGWHKSYLGQLYNPIFFNGGIAFHGALSVPLTPASHGCVRLPMQVAEVLPGLVGNGGTRARSGQVRPIAAGGGPGRFRSPGALAFP